MHLSQTKYIHDLLKKTNMLTSNPCNTPVIANIKISKHDGSPLDDPTEYKSLVGALQYVTWIRPKICYAINHMCQHMSNPTYVHLIAAKRILRYLKHTIDHRIVLQKGLTAHSSFYDSNWAGNLDDRRSTSG